MTDEERAVIDAALEWYSVSPRGDGDTEGIRYAVGALLALREPPGPRTELARELTWGQVPAGWYVQAPLGDWYRVIGSARRGDRQLVTLDIGGPRRAEAWPRDPAGTVTACPGPPNATDDAIEALGFPDVLEDGS
jgi:hypothetical protein